MATKIPALKDPVTKEYGDGGKEDGKQRNKGPENWNRATEKGKMGQLIGLGDRERRMCLGTGTGDKKQRRETRDRGRETEERSSETGDRRQETRNKEMRHGIEDRRQGTET